MCQLAGGGGRSKGQRMKGKDERAVGPGEDVGEAPGADLGFGFLAGGHGGGVISRGLGG